MPTHANTFGFSHWVLLARIGPPSQTENLVGALAWSQADKGECWHPRNIKQINSKLGALGSHSFETAVGLLVCAFAWRILWNESNAWVWTRLNCQISGIIDWGRRKYLQDTDWHQLSLARQSSLLFVCFPSLETIQEGPFCVYFALLLQCHGRRIVVPYRRNGLSIEAGRLVCPQLKIFHAIGWACLPNCVVLGVQRSTSKLLYKWYRHGLLLCTILALELAALQQVPEQVVSSLPRQMLKSRGCSKRQAQALWLVGSGAQ